LREVALFMPVAKLDLTDKTVFDGFACSNTEDANFIKDDIFKYQEEKLGVTYLLNDDTGKPTSFITIASGSLDLKHLKLDLPISERPTKLPALLIGRLATTKECERKGYGSRLIEFAIGISLKLSQITGIRLAIVHARTDAKIISFYRKNGFIPCFDDWAGRDTVPMYIDLKS